MLDIEMPKLDGIETTQVIKKTYPETKILTLTMYNKKPFILKLVERGVHGYILKNRSKEELVKAIHHIHRGNTYFGIDVTATLTSSSASIQEKVHLTQREIEVLCCIADGLTSKEIAAKLFIEATTVNTHRRNLLQKFDRS